jgi:hypothetical protein
MISPTRKIRGVQDIQTLSGKVEQVVVPHKAYMRISCLELEKFRRAKEKENSLYLIRKIDNRFQEIEAEKTALLQALDRLPSNDATKPPGNNQQVYIEADSNPQQSSAGFKIMY